MTGPHRVLVVDDDPDVRQLVAQLLRLSGFDVSTAGSGVEALAALGERDAADLPSLVLLDVQMPELDGWDTLRGIRSNRRLADLPVVLCTVKSSPADTALGWSIGCDGYVVKPFAIADLVDEIELVVATPPEHRRARRAAEAAGLTEAG